MQAVPIQPQHPAGDSNQSPRHAARKPLPKAAKPRAALRAYILADAALLREQRKSCQPVHATPSRDLRAGQISDPDFVMLSNAGFSARHIAELAIGIARKILSRHHSKAAQAQADPPATWHHHDSEPSRHQD